MTTARSGRWRRDLPPADQRLVQRVAGTLLAELGYPLEDLGRAGAAEQLRTVALWAKFRLIDLARRVLRALGVFNAARLLNSLPRRRPPDPTRAPAAERPPVGMVPAADTSLPDLTSAPTTDGQP